MNVFIRATFVTLLIIAILADDSCGGGSSQYSNTSTPVDTSAPTTVSSCQPQWVYDKVNEQGKALVVIDPEADYNGTSYPETITFTAEKTQTVSTTVDEVSFQKFQSQFGVQLGPFELGAIFEGVYQIDKTVVNSVKTTISNSPTLTIPPLKWGKGNYGVVVQIASGHFHSMNCPQDDAGTILSYTPTTATWCTWVSGPNLFKDSAQDPNCPSRISIPT